ncbi:hypothetical protein, partial [Pseudomonas syringae group genomosp. 7]|uniref:hypothetical protein n=1 Tax=Pseudomonas syringae group genomosp. 7 TaxID=251699 RepID=UPI0037706C77
PAKAADDLLDQIAPGVLFVFVVPPLLDAFVFVSGEAAGVELQAVASVVEAKGYALNEFFAVVFKQAAVGYLLVGDLATQFEQGPAKF